MAERSLTLLREYSPLEKAAILLASLDRPAAAKVLQRLTPDVVLKVTQSIRKLGLVPGPDRDRTIRECLQGIRQMGNAVQGNDHAAASLLTEVLGEKGAAALMSEGEASEGGMPGIARMDPRQAASLIEREPPGIVALIMRRLPGRAAAAILEALPRDLARRAVVFMCNSQPPSEKAVRRVEALLKMHYEEPPASGRAGIIDPLEAVTAILQQAGKDLGGELLDAIQHSSEEAANKIRDRLFTFDDIVRLTDMDMRRVLSETETAAVAVALRGTSEEVRQKVFGNMSARAAEGLREEMEYAQKVRTSEVQLRRRAIVDTIRRLEAEGQISTSGEDYV